MTNNQMFIITNSDKILLAKLVDAYYMANLSDAKTDGKDFWNSLSPDLCSTVCFPLIQAMRAILKSYDDMEVSAWIGGGMYMAEVDTFEQNARDNMKDEDDENNFGMEGL